MFFEAATLSGRLLVFTVAAVGVLHTAVPDHWVPITLLARQRGLTRRETAGAALQAGTGHVVTTLLIGLTVWLAGVAFTRRFSHAVDTIASAALVLFGLWTAVSAWRETRPRSARGHSHRGPFGHHHHHAEGVGQGHAGPIHRPERQRVHLGHGSADLSIHEEGVPPRFRFTGAGVDWIRAETLRKGGDQQHFTFVRRHGFWESAEEIPEPHGFEVVVTAGHGAHEHVGRVRFVEHEHGPGQQDHHDHHNGAERDPPYVPLFAGAAVLARHAHAHRHGGTVRVHWHEHDAGSAHNVPTGHLASPPAHEHRHRSSGRAALLLILGSSPMIEGIPVFFAASRYGAALLVLMAAVFAASTILTYVALCVASHAGLQRIRLGLLERHGELVSGILIALVGVVFAVWPLA